MGYFIESEFGSCKVNYPDAAEISALMKKKFDFAGKHEMVWVTAKRIASIIGVESNQSNCTMIGQVSRKMELKTKRGPNVRLILVPSYIND